MLTQQRIYVNLFYKFKLFFFLHASLKSNFRQKISFHYHSEIIQYLSAIDSTIPDISVLFNTKISH